MNNIVETFFWRKFVFLCDSISKSPNKVSSELGISNATATTWKKGRIPSGDTILKICKYFNVSADYLLTDSEANIVSSDKKIQDSTSPESVFGSVISCTQRWASLRHGNDISAELLNIASFVRCSPAFLLSSDYKLFSPISDNFSDSLEKFEVLELILDIMDRCADSSDLRDMQINLSNVVMYWLEKKGITYDILHNISDDGKRKYHGVSGKKLEFLYKRESVFGKIDPTFRYGFNFTELCAIRDVSGLSFLYMFTGIEYNMITEKLKLME